MRSMLASHPNTSMGSKENGLVIFRPPFCFCCKMTDEKIVEHARIGKTKKRVKLIITNL
jgi:hypothetical protein